MPSTAILPRPGGRPGLSVWVLAAVLGAGVLVPSSVVAQGGPPPGGWLEEASFPLEAIVVEGLERASPELIVAESLLEAGRDYTEQELRDAVDRVRRLPFLLDARFSLRKGGRRGTYVLIIEVEETRRFFFGTNWEIAVSNATFGLGVRDRPSSLEADGERDDFSSTAGVRFFTGAQGVAFLALRNEGGVEAGYAHHDLFGRHIFGSVSLAIQENQGRTFSLGVDPALSHWSLEGVREVDAEAAVPLSARAAVRLSLSYLGSDEVRGSPLLVSSRSFRLFRATDLRRLRLAASWVYDTRDDPVLPTRGVSGSAGLTAESLTTSETVVTLFERPFGSPRREEPGPAVDSVAVTAVASGTHHWPLTRRLTLSSGLRGSLGRSRVGHLAATGAFAASTRLTTYELSAALRGSLELRNPRRPRPHGDLRLELQASYGLEGTSPSLDLNGNPFRTRDLELALVARNRWGLFRFAITYQNVGRIR